MSLLLNMLEVEASLEEVSHCEQGLEEYIVSFLSLLFLELFILCYDCLLCHSALEPTDYELKPLQTLNQN